MENLYGLLSPFACFLLHVLLYRLVPPLHKLPRQILTVVVIVIVTFAMILFVSPHAGFLSLLFGYVYFHWFNMSETARRIRILVGHVSGTAATEPYDPKMIFHQRIERLLEIGTLTRKGDLLVLKRGPLVWATRVIFFWRKLFYPEN